MRYLSITYQIGKFFKSCWTGVEQWFLNQHISITWELVRNANSQSHPRLTQKCVL